jgi:hypothetical protein
MMLVTMVVRRSSGVAHWPDCEWLPTAIRDPGQYERETPFSEQLEGRERAFKAYDVREVTWPPRLRLCPTCARSSRPVP